MGIFDRLGNVIRSYIGGGAEGTERKGSGDPDLDAAYEELDGFLKQDPAGGGKAAGTRAGGKAAVPEGLRRDFAELGLEPEASEGECKAAYKRLLKVHHPDRHAGHEGNMKKATEKSARLNAAYDRIEKWRREGKPGDFI
jgi:DnaJ-domain-containing protein 1